VKAANAAARTARPQIRTFRFSILIGALLVPIVTLWVANLEEVHFIRTTYLSVFFHAILILAALAGFNALLRLIAPRYGFHRAERPRLLTAQAVATVLGSFAGVWALLHVCYPEGVEQMQQPVQSLSQAGWRIVNGWLVAPPGPCLTGPRLFSPTSRPATSTRTMPRRL